MIEKQFLFVKGHFSRQEVTKEESVHEKQRSETISVKASSNM